MKQNILTYNGSQYHLALRIFSPTSRVDYDNITKDEFDVLLYENVEKLEFENDLSNPLLIGELIYKDNSDSVLNKFLTVSCRYLNITIKKLKNLTTISANEIVEEDLKFDHTFIITSIDKIKQEDSVITYSLKYVSTHWWNFNSNVLYSTHNNTYNSKKSPIEILKILYNQCGLDFDVNDISTKALTHFLSDTDESLKTAQQYLLKRMYDLEALDSPGLIKVIYDYITNRYMMWSLRKHSGDSYVSEVYPTLTAEEVNRNTITLPMFNKYIDTLGNQDPTSIDIVNFGSLELEYPNEFGYSYWTYDYATNTFKKKDVTNENILQSLPYLKNDILNFEKKHFEIETMLSKKEYKGNRIFNRESSQWDENHWPYDDIDDIFLKNGLIRINTSGNMLRKAGDNTFLTVDKTDFSSLLRLKGDWVNTRVVHVFTNSSYRNIMLLSRVNISLANKQTEIFERL